MSPRPKGRPSRSFFRQFPDQVTVVDTLRVESSSLTSRGIGFGVLELVVDLRSAVGKCCVALSINRFECPRQRAVDWPESRFITFRNTSRVLVSWVSADKYRTILTITVASTYLILEDSKMDVAMPCTLASYVYQGSEGNLTLRSVGAPCGMPSYRPLRSNGAPSGMPSYCCQGVLAPSEECLPIVMSLSCKTFVIASENSFILSSKFHYLPGGIP